MVCFLHYSCLPLSHCKPYATENEVINYCNGDLTVSSAAENTSAGLCRRRPHENTTRRRCSVPARLNKHGLSARHCATGHLHRQPRIQRLAAVCGAAVERGERAAGGRRATAHARAPVRRSCRRQEATVRHLPEYNTRVILYARYRKKNIRVRYPYVKSNRSRGRVRG